MDQEFPNLPPGGGLSAKQPFIEQVVSRSLSQSEQIVILKPVSVTQYVYNLIHVIYNKLVNQQVMKMRIPSNKNY